MRSMIIGRGRQTLTVSAYVPHYVCCPGAIADRCNTPGASREAARLAGAVPTGKATLWGLGWAGGLDRQESMTGRGMDSKSPSLVKDNSDQVEGRKAGGDNRVVITS